MSFNDLFDAPHARIHQFTYMAFGRDALDNSARKFQPIILG